MAYTTINKSSDYFNTKLYTGNGSTQSIQGVGFRPDWVWLKKRDASASHELYDAVRGATKRLKSDATNAEFTDANTLTSFDNDGFSLGSGSGINSSSNTFVSWNWKANGQGSSNTDGSINTTYTSANTTSGFSMVKYTGTGSNATVGHGLGSVPKVVWVKGLGHTSQWYVYSRAVGSNKVGLLDNTSSWATDTVSWQNTHPTSSVFSIGNDGGTNGSGNTYIAYCFAEKKGFSKFGSYTGNGNADGTFVYLGFKPAFVLFKQTSSAGNNWTLQDNKREGFNPNNRRLYPNDYAVENTSSFRIDMLSNGFKLRSSDSDANASETFFYMAFAEAPLVGSNNVPCTAR